MQFMEYNFFQNYFFKVRTPFTMFQSEKCKVNNLYDDICYCELILLLFRDSTLYQMKNSAEMTIFSRAGESVKNANMLR